MARMAGYAEPAPSIAALWFSHGQARPAARREKQMAFFNNEKYALHYLVRGRGEPLVLIHGLGGSGADWAFQVAVLEKRFRVIVPDLPGSGHSPPPRDEYTIAGSASALWSLLDHLAVPRATIIGFSLGGAVALERATPPRAHQQLGDLSAG